MKVTTGLLIGLGTFGLTSFVGALNLRSQFDEARRPTQVHLRFGTPPGTCMVVRFKGPGGISALIDALVEHRDFVWGKP